MAHIPPARTRTANIRVGLHLMRFPAASETFIVAKVLGLLEAGFDLQIFAAAPSGDHDQFPDLMARADLRARIHVGPPLRPVWRVLTTGLGRLLLTALARPVAFARPEVESRRKALLRQHWCSPANPVLARNVVSPARGG